MARVILFFSSKYWHIICLPPVICCKIEILEVGIGISGVGVDEDVDGDKHSGNENGIYAVAKGDAVISGEYTG